MYSVFEVCRWLEHVFYYLYVTIVGCLQTMQNNNIILLVNILLYIHIVIVTCKMIFCQDAHIGKAIGISYASLECIQFFALLHMCTSAHTHMHTNTRCRC